jgi:uncharacterized protein (TIGR00297 family)
MRDLAQIAEAAAGLGMPTVRQLWIAGGVTVAFSALARCIRGVSPSGAVAGAPVCFLLYAGAGPGAFAALVSVFALAWITTRLGYQRKQRLGTAEKQDGRTASQVLANLGVAACCAALYAASHGKAIFLLATAAALSEAAADTVSSEVGQASSEKARLITTWEQVPAGTDGGISLVGTLAGIAAAALVSLVCFLTGFLPAKWLGTSVAAAVLGMVADSYLGAWLERRQLLNNDTVNFLSTLIAAGATSLLA